VVLPAFAIQLPTWFFVGRAVIVFLKRMPTTANVGQSLSQRFWSRAMLHEILVLRDLRLKSGEISPFFNFPTKVEIRNQILRRILRYPPNA